jgi:hypothetical protein
MPHAAKAYSFRRGTYPAAMHCLAFSPEGYLHMSCTALCSVVLLVLLLYCLRLGLCCLRCYCTALCSAVPPAWCTLCHMPQKRTVQARYLPGSSAAPAAFAYCPAPNCTASALYCPQGVLNATCRKSIQLQARHLPCSSALPSIQPGRLPAAAACSSKQPRHRSPLPVRAAAPVSSSGCCECCRRAAVSSHQFCCHRHGKLLQLLFAGRAVTLCMCCVVAAKPSGMFAVTRLLAGQAAVAAVCWVSYCRAAVSCHQLCWHRYGGCQAGVDYHCV